MSPDSITLIGFMATGKSTVGNELAKRLGNDYRLIETDEIVESLANKSIPKIFAEDGEIKFREYEIEACKRVSNYKKAIISCGGGVVLNRININYLKRNSIIILLKASPDIIYERATKEGKEKRPVIDKQNVREEIRKILEFRKPLYKAAADITVDTSNKTVDTIVKEIIKKTHIKDEINKKK